MAGEQQPPVFGFEGTWPFGGAVTVNGHPAAAVTGFSVQAGADEIPVISLTLMGAGALKLLMDSGAARLGLDDDSRAALQSLGWTPPPESS